MSSANWCACALSFGSHGPCSLLRTPHLLAAPCHGGGLKLVLTPNFFVLLRHIVFSVMEQPPKINDNRIENVDSYEGGSSASPSAVPVAYNSANEYSEKPEQPFRFSIAVLLNIIVCLLLIFNFAPFCADSQQYL